MFNPNQAFVLVQKLKSGFTLGVKVDVQPKSSIRIGAKVEIGLHTKSQS
jgi:hypothetical protein